MKKTLSAFIFIFSFSCVFSQEEDIRKYYKYANKAELSICDGKYAKASRFYDKAFKYKTYPFDRDLINALLCEIYSDLNNSEKTLDYTYKLATKSFNVKARIKDLEHIVDSTLFQKITTIIDTTPSKLNVDLLKAFDILDSLDQTPRRNCRGYRQECVGIIMLNDSLNLLTIDSLYKVYGSINEENIGSVEMNNTFFLILMHNFQWLKHPFQEKLLSEVLNGNIDAREYAWLEDFYLTRIDKKKYEMQSGFEILDRDVFLIYHNLDNIKHVNKKRQAIYIESYEDQVKKTIYKYILNSKGFRMGMRERFDMPDDEFSEWLERWKKNKNVSLIRSNGTYIK